MKYTGYVYKAICTCTNKCYIGITTVDIITRRNQHIWSSFNENSEDYNVHFHRAIRKYGKENFKWEIICTLELDNKEELIEVLKLLEIRYVEKYDSYNNGYNSTKGGDTITILEKKVKAFSENGELLRIFDSRRETSKFYGISEDCVGAVCNRRQRFSYIDGVRYIFRNEDDDYTENDISTVKSQKGNPYCRVQAYLLENGGILKDFNSIKEGAEYFKVKPSTISEIINNYGSRKSSGKVNGKKIGWRRL